jgi:hypothetical protein
MSTPNIMHLHINNNHTHVNHNPQQPKLGHVPTIEINRSNNSYRQYRQYKIIYEYIYSPMSIKRLIN